MSELKIPVLPENAELSYLGEGAANIVYRIAIPQPQPGTPPLTELEEYGEGTPPPSEIELDYDTGDANVFENNLLRLRKDLPTTFPCILAQSTWSRLISPLFAPSQLVSQSLVSLRPGLYNHITTLNSSLLAWEKESPADHLISKKAQNEGEPRPLKRHGVYLSNDPHGLLVTDMSGPGVVQFKPKWLAQSRSAPVGARRCRQCALGARKAFLSTSKSKASQSQTHNAQLVEGGNASPSFCPLDLLSTDEEILRGVARSIILSQPTTNPDTSPPNTAVKEEEEEMEEILNTLTNWLLTTSLLRKLRNVQLAMDKTGILAAESPPSEELRVAMTVRDCSVFVRVGSTKCADERGRRDGDCERDEKKTWEEEVEARIGDLDVKSPEKLTYWKETERVLVEEGWYAGRVEEGGEITCALGRR